MRLNIKAKQVAGVTSIVGLAVVVLSGYYLSTLARIRLEETEARGDLLANAIFQRAGEVVAGSQDPVEALRTDAGLRSILQSSAYARHVTYAAIVDVMGRAIAHSDPSLIGQQLPSYEDLGTLLTGGPMAQIRAIYTEGGRTLEVRQPLLLGTAEFGSIRIGLSTLLIRGDLDQAMRPALYTVLAALAAASIVAMLLAQLLLKPIHVIRSGLTRLGQGEFGVRVDLPHDEFGELGEFFNTVSARLSADRTRPTRELAPGHAADHLADAVAIFDPAGVLLFANKAMRDSLDGRGDGRRLDDLWPPAHAYRQAVENTRKSRQPYGPATAQLPEPAGERLIATHPIAVDGRVQGVVLIARNLDYLMQIQSTITHSRKLAALSRLSAGVAHEVKNPLNATVIHLELLKEQLSSASSPAPSAAAEHVSIISAQMRRLDEVVQGFLRFIRPEDLKLESVSVASLVEAISPVVSAEAEKHGVDVRLEIPDDLPPVRVDPGMMQQALLNLALNACQAMPGGGHLRLAGALDRTSRVEISCEDTGHGIKPQDLDKIFNLYFTTKEHGSGIGLSMVYRTVQLHDGEIEVQSIPGRGTIFRVVLPQA